MKNNTKRIPKCPIEEEKNRSTKRKRLGNKSKDYDKKERKENKYI